MTTGRINQVSLLDKVAHRSQLLTRQRKDAIKLGFTAPFSLFLEQVQSMPYERLASTLSFFGFLNLRSRNHDLNESIAAKKDE